LTEGDVHISRLNMQKKTRVTTLSNRQRKGGEGGRRSWGGTITPKRNPGGLMREGDRREKVYRSIDRKCGHQSIEPKETKGEAPPPFLIMEGNGRDQY